MHGEQDIQKMGGLNSLLPITSKTFLLAAIAIAGIPPFSGFFSKDEILWAAFAHGEWILWFVGLVGAGLTAFYMFRLYTLTFAGEPRWPENKHPHESPPVMTIPLTILAFLSVVGGLVGIPASLGGSNTIEHWLDPVFERAQAKIALSAVGEESLEYVLMALSVAVAVAGIYLARTWYLRTKEMPERVRQKVPGLYALLFNKYYVDEAYDAAVVNPIVKGSDKLLWKGMDVGVIDWLVNAVAQLVAWVSKTVRVVQNGITETYVFVFLVGVFVILGWLITKL